MFKTYEEMDATHQTAYRMGYYDGMLEINKLLEKANRRFDRKLIVEREDRHEEDRQRQH